MLQGRFADWRAGRLPKALLHQLAALAAVEMAAVGTRRPHELADLL